MVIGSNRIVLTIFALWVCSFSQAGSWEHIRYDTCFTGKAVAKLIVWVDDIGGDMVELGEGTNDIELRINIDGGFQCEEVYYYPPSLTIFKEATKRSVGQWKALAGKEILLTVEEGELFAGAGIYDDSTAKGIRRVDKNQYILDLSLKSIYLSERNKLKRRACRNFLRGR